MFENNFPCSNRQQIYNWYVNYKLCIFSRQVMSNSLQPRRLWHARPPCPSPSPRACPSSCLLNWWCHLTISSSVTLFSFGLQSLPASGYFPMSRLRLLTSGGQSIVSSASVLPMSIQGWFPLGLADLISLLSKGPSRVLSSTSGQKHQFFSALPFLWSSSHIHT